MTSRGCETRAATAKKAATEGESAGSATAHKMAAGKLATPAAAQAMAREFASLQKGMGESQPTFSQLRAASAVCASRASLATGSGHESPLKMQQVRQLIVFVGTCLLTLTYRHLPHQKPTRPSLGSRSKARKVKVT
jgi:hypothetical protein